jgi:hypothetical protein
MTRIVQCAHCKTVDITEKTVYHGRKGEILGEWPLYYVGNPMDPHLAEHYFCGVYCANDWYKEKRNAT